MTVAALGLIKRIGRVDQVTLKNLNEISSRECNSNNGAVVNVCSDSRRSVEEPPD